MRAGAAGTIKYEDFFGTSAPYRNQKAPRGDASEGSDASGVDDTDSSGDDVAESDADVAGSDAAADGGGAGSRSGGGGGSDQVLSTHEKRQLRVAREIERVEGELMADKAWQFRGEATAKQRPKDSALEVDLVRSCCCCGCCRLLYAAAPASLGILVGSPYCF